MKITHQDGDLKARMVTNTTLVGVQPEDGGYTRSSQEMWTNKKVVEPTAIGGSGMEITYQDGDPKARIGWSPVRLWWG